VESVIDSRLAADGSSEEYKNRVIGFYQGEGVYLNVTLAFGLLTSVFPQNDRRGLVFWFCLAFARRLHQKENGPGLSKTDHSSRYISVSSALAS